MKNTADSLQKLTRYCVECFAVSKLEFVIRSVHVASTQECFREISKWKNNQIISQSLHLTSLILKMGSHTVYPSKFYCFWKFSKHLIIPSSSYWITLERSQKALAILQLRQGHSMQEAMFTKSHSIAKIKVDGYVNSLEVSQKKIFHNFKI